MDIIEEWLFERLTKGSGEGSRGGNIVGHTKSGKPIYGDAKHKSHVDFDKRDHMDAANHHIESAEDHSKSLQEKIDKDPSFEGPKANELRTKIKETYERGHEHQRMANRKLNQKEDRGSGHQKAPSAQAPIDAKTDKFLRDNPSLQNLDGDVNATPQQKERANKLINQLAASGRKKAAIKLHKRFFGNEK